MDSYISKKIYNSMYDRFNRINWSILLLLFFTPLIGFGSIEIVEAQGEGDSYSDDSFIDNVKIKPWEEKKNQIKIKDIQLLISMLNVIENYQTKKINLNNTLIEIGDFANQITFADKDKSVIRNQYGYIQRNL